MGIFLPKNRLRSEQRRLTHKLRSGVSTPKDKNGVQRLQSLLWCYQRLVPRGGSATTLDSGQKNSAIPLPSNHEHAYRTILPWLRLPEELHEGINERLVVHILNTNHPCMPVQKAICFHAGKVHGIEIPLIRPFKFIGRAAMFELIAMKCIWLVKSFYQFRHDHIME